ncbi:hypothetical protein MKK88_23610 [Methylobacterium sp. E-005]|uniref:hypothetical protein n=1 Tax=Methylobacterium sp. E-005 TaxID=2836549 RepID=UPI001FBA98D3|nr:hypothetical protein [Methylobacterium sp. E-005]MCJ2088945.1 hypothetical protein [Methylobacterium sp. E-005]
MSDPGWPGPFKTTADAIMPPRSRCLRSLLIVGTLTLAGSSVAPDVARATLSSAVRIVLQKGRQYAPTDLYLRQGDTITLRNGDDGLTHHAFIEADRFSFDAGDQEPGAETRLTLSEPGDFVIQCGIHPKMKLTIHVE